MFGFGKPKPQKPSPAEVYVGLRNQLFTLNPSEIGLKPSTETPVVWGVLMETGLKVATYTLVGLADGTTSLYFSNGGGMIGCGQHDSVAKATARLIAMAQKFSPLLTATQTYPAPSKGQVRFYLLTFSGVLTSEAVEVELGNHHHQLSPLFHQCHEVIAAVRVTQE